MAIVSNTLATSSILSKFGAKSLRNNMVLTSRVRNDIVDAFEVPQYKTGQTITVSRPARYTVSTGAALSKQNSTESTVSLTVVQRHVDIAFTEVEKKTSIRDMAAFTDSVMTELMSAIEVVGADLMWKRATNLVTPGALSSGSPAQPTGATVGSFELAANARAVLSDNAIPTNDKQITLALEPFATAKMHVDIKGLFNPQDQLGNQYKTGMLGRTLGFDVVESQVMGSYVTGTRLQAANPAVDGASQTGASLLLKSVGNAVTIKEGEKFTLAGAYAINPKSRASLAPRLQVFTVLADATSSADGAVTLSISPSINVTSPNQTVSATAADNAVVTWMGATAGVTSRVNLAFHKESTGFVSLALPTNKPGTDTSSFTDEDTGIKVTVTTFYNGYEGDETVTRFDTLTGWTIVRPEAIVLIIG